VLKVDVAKVPSRSEPGADGRACYRMDCSQARLRGCRCRDPMPFAAVNWSAIGRLLGASFAQNASDPGDARVAGSSCRTVAPLPPSPVMVEAGRVVRRPPPDVAVELEAGAVGDRGTAVAVSAVAG
jgi:hypothetical protein